MGTEQTSITLRVDGTRKDNDTSLSGWEAEVFALGGVSRGAADAAEPLVLAPDDVLELQLADGTSILVAAADAERYLGSATARDGERGNAIQVGQTLRLSGTRQPEGMARDGFGAWILKSLRIYRKGPAAMTALAAAGTFQDAQLEDRVGLYRCATDAFGLSKVDALPESSEPTLLFLHGTASSTEGSFGDLWKNDGYRRQLAASYGPRLFAFEHRSMTESPIANALDLVKLLPNGARLHLVSHSRGGVVGELLARANRIGLEPFTDADIELFRAHARRIGRDGYDEDAERLRELNRELTRRGIRIERFVRVACPARGTTLVSGKADRWASVMLNLLGKGFDAAGHAIPGLVPVARSYALLKTFLLAVVRQRCDTSVLPGVEAVMPESPLVALLNAPDVRIDPPLYVLAGDFEGDGLLPWLGDCLSEVFYGGASDLVVNTPSMSGGAAREQGIRQKRLSGPQVTHFTYFGRDESALALLAALRGDGSQFELLDGPSRATISRGGIKPKRKDNAPIAFVLPGIMGSHIQLGRDRIWFDPINMWAGEMAKLKVDAPNVATDGWMDRNYESLARYLADSHEVRPFVYDWRLSIVAAAERFGEQLDRAMEDAAGRGQPVRIVAHSMGGLVARLALQTRWERFKAMPGSRLLQLGTPNNGSHSIATVLMARDDFVQTIERWFDWNHDMREFIEIIRDYPGVLELLPWPGENGCASDGADYFDAGVWQGWYDKDQDSRKGKCWLAPAKGPLDKARKAVAEVRAAKLDPERTLYVAGRASTPAAVRVVDGQVEIGWVEEGDGRVLWKTGIPPGAPVWYADAAHGDLASHEKAFAAYRDLLETGNTNDSALSRAPSVSRGDASPVFRPRGLDGNALYPSAEEVMAAATGGARPGRRVAMAEPPAIIEVVHGSVANAETPVLVGSYANDSLRGSAKFIDGHLDGQLQRAHDLGRYPARTDDAMFFPNAVRNGRPAGAIVVGLGILGELLPGKLVEALCNGLLEYARSHDQGRASAVDDGGRLSVAALLVGTGFTGLSVEVGTRCLLEALLRANAALCRTGAGMRIARLTIYEETENRAIAAAQALREHAADARFAPAVRFDGRLRCCAGGFRGRCVASGGAPGAYRVHIIENENGGLRFTVITDRARNEVATEADQRQAVDGLIASLTAGTGDQRGLSRALFELMMPNGVKGIVAEVRTLMMSVDAAAAAYPWELMRDGEQPEAEPLAVRVEMVRQLASSHGRGRVPTASGKQVFIVGDTRSDLPELPGAQAEAASVARIFSTQGHAVNAIYRATSLQVFEGLFCGRYRFMHLAGHGVVKDKATGQTGMVLGPKNYLTAAQVNQLRHVPEFVFINCCHLGSTREDAMPRWSELAANLATQFIEMGCKAVVAAGWAVDDAAATSFAEAFYNAMFGGKRFAQAVLQARAATYRQHGSSNTWGAFQAYGDDRYSFPHTYTAKDATSAYVHASHIVADLDMLCARLQGASQAEKKEHYLNSLETIEAAARGPDLQSAAVHEKLAEAWASLDDKARAIGHYRDALAMENGGASLKALERLASLEIDLGADLLEARDKHGHAAGEKYLQSGRERLDLALAIGETTERQALIGAYWKRCAQVNLARGRHKEIGKCFTNMRKACWQAAEHARRIGGEWDYAPLFNAMDAAFLGAARGENISLDAPEGQLANMLRLGTESARRRLAESREFVHALAEVEAERIDALWACYDGRDASCIVAGEVLKRLIDRYRDLLDCYGTTADRESTLARLRFLVAMLPRDERTKPVRGALQELIDGIAG